MSRPDFSVTSEIRDEMDRQVSLWGEQNHPDGTAITGDEDRANRYRDFNAQLVALDNLTWRDILLEEVMEALAESDLDRLREELLQVAAVASSWVEAIDRRTR